MAIIKRFLIAVLIAAPVHAADMKGMHEVSTFHMIRLDTDIGDSSGRSFGSWDLDGWVGGDVEKLWLQSEGEIVGGNTEEAELWAMYSRNIATYWDAQAGIRYDWQPTRTAYLVAGFEGLASYYFETQAHLFVSDKGDVSARIREENDLLLTQRFIAQPYAEIEAYAQDVPEKQVGAGLSNIQVGLQTRYEITRKFAPYVDVSYQRKLGETGRLASANGERKDEFISAIGLRLMF